MATVHLPSYINKNVEVTYRNGNKYTGKLIFSEVASIEHPYILDGRTYTKKGFYYDEDESYSYDIVSIRSLEGPTKYSHLEEQVAELQAEIERLKAEEEAEKPKPPEGFRRKNALKLLDGQQTYENVNNSFIWRTTPQGDGYWRSLAQKCRGGGRLPEDAIKYLQEMVILSYRQEHGD